MTQRYGVLDDAKHELVAAARYHEEQRLGLGLKVFDAFDAVVERARTFPTAGKPVKLDSKLAHWALVVDWTSRSSPGSRILVGSFTSRGQLQTLSTTLATANPIR